MTMVRSEVCNYLVRFPDPIHVSRGTRLVTTVLVLLGVTASASCFQDIHNMSPRNLTKHDRSLCRLTKQIYLYDQHFSKCNPHLATWSSEIADIISQNNLSAIVHTQSPKIVLSLLKNSLLTRDQNMHRRECLKSDKLRTYNTLFDPFVPHESVIEYTRQCLPFILRKRLSQLRLGCLPIRIESDRYTRPIVHRDLRYCLQPKCKNVADNLDDNLKDVDNEFHFLIVCSQYNSLRNVLYSKIESPSFATMTDNDKFIYLLTTPSVAKIVAQFIVDAFDERPVKM